MLLDLGNFLHSAYENIADFGSILFSAASAAWITLPPLLTCAIVSSGIGGCLAVAEHRSLLPKPLTRLVVALILLTIFYPRQISQSGLTYLVTIFAHAHFAQSAWGLAVVSIPTSAAMAYLIFSTSMSVSDVTSLPAQFLKNSANAPFARTVLIMSVPIQPMMAAVTSIVFCGISFQAALVGRSGANTIGSYFLRRSSTIQLDYASRALLVLAAGICLLCLLAGTGFAIYWLLRKLSVIAIEAFPSSRVAKGFSNRSLVVAFVSAAALLSGLVAFLLHVFLLLRLGGFAGTVVQWFGVSHGALEATLPTLSFAAIERTFDGIFDSALAGALLGASCSILLWFVIARKARTPRRTLWIRMTYLLALLAFLPSAFSGSIALTMPLIKVTQPLLLLVWGIITAFCLTLLLISPQLMKPSLSRYFNLDRTRGAFRSARLFLSEYGVLCFGLLTACLVSNALDSGFRDQMGIKSLGKQFIDRQGSWDPDLRGIALLIMAAAVLATISLGRGRTVGEME